MANVQHILDHQNDQFRRYKRDSINEQEKNGDNSSSPINTDAVDVKSDIKKSNTKKRIIRKLIRKLSNNTQTNIKNENTHKIHQISDNDDNDNSTTNLNISSSRQTILLNPTKRRRVVPITRKRNVTSSSIQAPIANNSGINLNNTKQHPKRKIIVTKKRILPKLAITLSNNNVNLSELSGYAILSTEPSLIIPSIQSKHSIPSSIVYTTTETYLETSTPRLATKQRTYTYVVTRVHDEQTEIMSTTSIRQQIQTIIDTVTKTSTLTLTVPFVPMTMTATLTPTITTTT